MSRLLLKILEGVAHLRLSLSNFNRKRVTVGPADGADANGSTQWKSYASAEALYGVWGPAAESPWEAFHCVTLFAAIDSIPTKMVGPWRPPTVVEGGETFQLPNWVARDIFVIIDLPGPVSVDLACRLCSSGRFQPVCAFDNWPDPKGVIKPEKVLGALLHYSPRMADVRPLITASAAPLWVCDSERLGKLPGRPGDFDNRYFLDDSLLPGAAVLRQNGVNKVIYIARSMQETETVDLTDYMNYLIKSGFEILKCVPENGLERLEPLVPQKVKFNPLGFFRSTAGGFGAPVPHPSSSSG